MLQIFGLFLSLWPLQLDQPPAPPPTVIGSLIGEWKGQGELFGKPAEFSMSWSWELDRRFVRLNFENRLVKDGQSRTVLTAIAFYRVADSGELDGYWFDTRGQILRLEPEAGEAALLTLWFGESEQGRTTYHVTSKNTVEVRDEVFVNGSWQPFGVAAYERATD